MKTYSKTLHCLALLLLTSLNTSCATSVGMAAAAVTSATISVGTTIVTAPFKMMGAMSDNDDNDGNADEDNNN